MAEMQNYAENDWEKFRVYWAILRPCGIILSAALWTLCRYRHKVHSTGHKDRLNRENFIGSFGDHNYSKEEFVAETGAAFLCAIAGITKEHIEQNTTAYIQSWISILKSDSKMIVQAAAQAQKAADMILMVPLAEESADDPS